MFSSWRALFGDPSAVACAKAFFQRCIAERWGSVDQMESRLLKAGVGRLAEAACHMFKVSPGLLDQEASVGSAQDVDTLALDDRKAYKS